jgi:uroporphyrinogen decarboxylase
MAQPTKRERVDAALRGEAPDRVPVAAWRHFVPEERAAESLAEASLRFFDEFDWDWLKVNPRATYYAEAWGNRYNYDDYAGVLPQLVDSPLRGPQDLERITPQEGTGGVFGEQLDLLRRIKGGIGGAHFVQTVFSPLSVLAFLTARPGNQTADLGLGSRFEGLQQLIHQHPQEVHGALQAIAETLARYSAASLEAGASGLFYAIVRLAREGVLTPEEYAIFGRPYDLQVLRAVQGAPFNLLHICGPAVYFEQVADYPVHAINWAAVGQRNPTIAEARERTSLALIGGVDEAGAIQHGTPEVVLAEARAAIESSGGRGFLLAPGCGVAMDVRAENLRGLRRAAY